MGTFIIKSNEQMIAGIPVGRLKNLDDRVVALESAVDNEVVSGSGTSFTLANTPVAGSVHVYALGRRLKLTTDYSISGTGITTVESWSAGDLVADYRK